MDRDTTPIGGLAKPEQPTKQLFHVTVIMDVLAVLAGSLISWIVSLGILLYILASRAYSYRGIRLKKYPVLGYLTVVIFQGAMIFFLAYHGSSVDLTLNVPVTGMIASSFLIGGYYPLTQVYQHKEDLKDGVTTISYLLGTKGTFIFSALMFGLATFFLFMLYNQSSNLAAFWLFVLCMSPMVWFFVYWMSSVWRNSNQASFRNSLWMNVLAAICTTICFSILILKKII